MKFIRRNVLTIIIVSILLFLYRNWFSKGALSAPDFPYLYPLAMGDFIWRPFAWSHLLGNGYGGTTYAVLNLNTYLSIGVRIIVFLLHIPWNAAYRLLFFWPFLILGGMSAYYFCRTVLRDARIASVGMLIYMSNTYILMLAGGGQVGLMMAYALVPLALASFIRRNTVLFTAAMGFLLLFDLRFSYLTAGCLIAYFMFVFPPKEWVQFVKFSFIPLVIVIGMHSFWLVPFFFSRSASLPAGYDNPGWLVYLSWAEFSKTVSLLQPNWPENIFGKTYFMQPQFLLLPVFAFGSLLSRELRTVHKTQKNTMLFFAAIGLVGAFFAKGINPPFGGLYVWMFAHLPLFNGFRDPTKFYLFVALSYTVLVPFFLFSLMQYVQRLHMLHQVRSRIHSGILLMFVLIWIMTIWPAVNGTLSGTFAKPPVPSEYDDLAKSIYSIPHFSRTLAVPWRNRFIYQSEDHPIVDARDMFNTTDIRQIVMALEDPGAQNVLQSLAVQYIVVPRDSTHEIFLRERAYDAGLRESVVRSLDALPFLEKKKGFGDIDVYEFTRIGGLFYTQLPNLDFSTFPVHVINPVTYTVDVTTPQRPVDVIFSQTYDSHWRLWDGTKIIFPEKTKAGTMRFVLDTNITGALTVYHSGQRLLDIGTAVSAGVAVILSGIGLLVLSKQLGLGYTLPVVLFSAFAASWFVSLPHGSSKNISADKHIWWSKEWMRLQNPFVSGDTVVSRYGGSEVRFRISKTRSLTVVASSPNSEAHIQGVDLFVGDSKFTMETPLHKSTLSLPSGTLDPRTTYDIRIRHWCAGTLWPCDVDIRGILTDRDATVLQPPEVPGKMLAVLGDSIAVSFGNMNAMYLLADRLGYQLHNASIFGSSVSVLENWDSALARYQEDIVRYKPDMVVVFLGTNDLGLGVPLAIFQANYEKLVTGILQGTPQSHVIIMGLMRRKDYSFVAVKAYSDVIRSVAQKYNLFYIDPYDWLTENDLQDVVHPAPRSESKIMDKLFDAIQSNAK